MKVFILSISFILFTNVLSAQISMVRDVKKFKESIKDNPLIIVTTDTVLQNLYNNVFTNNWSYGTFAFSDPEAYVNNLHAGKFYLKPTDVVFVGHWDGVGSHEAWTDVYKYLTLYIASDLHVEKMKSKTDKIDQRDIIRHTKEHSSIDQCIILPLEKKKIDGVLRYNFGIMKNNLQQIKQCFDNEKGSVYYRDFANEEKLAQLKTQTLYIVVDDPNNVPFKGELSTYPYAYKFITNKALEDSILHTNSEFYYMHFAYTPDKYQFQIGIVNSLTGEEIFHDKTMNMSDNILISDRKINFLVKKINSK